MDFEKPIEVNLEIVYGFKPKNSKPKYQFFPKLNRKEDKVKCMKILNNYNREIQDISNSIQVWDGDTKSYLKKTTTVIKKHKRRKTLFFFFFFNNNNMKYFGILEIDKGFIENLNVLKMEE